VCQFGFKNLLTNSGSLVLTGERGATSPCAALAKK